MTSGQFNDRSIKKVNETHAILQDDSDYRSAAVINIRDPSTSRNRNGTSAKTIASLITIAVCLFVFYAYLVRSGVLKDLILNAESWLRGSWETHPALTLLTVYLVIQVLIVFCLGFKMIVFVVTAVVIQKTAISFPLLFLSCVSGDALVYLVCRYWLRKHIVAWFVASDFYIVLLEESKSEPFTTAFVTRFLFIPNGLKNYVLMAIDNSAKSYFLTGALFHFYFTIQALVIAAEFGQISDYYNSEKSWSQRTPAQQFTFIAFGAFLVFTIALAVYLGIWAKRRIDAKKRARADLSTKDYELN